MLFLGGKCGCIRKFHEYYPQLNSYYQRLEKRVNMWFFSADWHLGHANIIKYCRRPFMTSEEEGLLNMADRGTIPVKELRISQASSDQMTNTIIDSTNAVVRDNDSLVINGDFCFTPRDDRFDIIKRYRDQINCKNVYLIWGNHDDRRPLNVAKQQYMKDLFSACYEQYMFNISGQHIFVSHYPCRSWDRKAHGSWMLYGHVHNLYWPEDNGQLMPHAKQVFSDGFQYILEKYGVQNESGERDSAVNELLDLAASMNGVNLTLDVGVDNVRPGVSFGTPWSMTDLESYFGNKRACRSSNPIG